MAFFDRDLASILRGDILGIGPKLSGSGDTNSSWIDRLSARASDGSAELYDSMFVTAMTGAVSNAACSVTYAVQDADDASGTNALAYTPPGASAAAAVTLSGKTGSNSSKGLGVDLSAARRYINIKATVTAAGSDTVGIAAGVALGGAKQRPGA